MANPYIKQTDGKRVYYRLEQAGSGSGINQLTGDVVAGPGTGSQAATLRTVNPDVGTFGDSTHVPQITIDAKGRITVAADVAIAAGSGGINQLTGDVTAGPGTGSQMATLANIVAGGNYGTTTQVPQLTVDTKGRITAIANVGIAGISPTSMPKASEVGILTTGDQTANLNAVFTNSAYAGIIMDYSAPNSVRVDGAVDCKGKMIFFWNGSFFTSSVSGIGTGSFTNGVIAAGLYQKCFTTNISLINFKTTTGRFSALWYGYILATGDTGFTIQKCIDTVIANQATIRTLAFASGSYIITQPLVSYSWNGTSYQQHSIRYEGDSPYWQRSGTGAEIITSGFRDSFALGIQIGKGVEVTHIKFRGAFTPPTQTDYVFFTSPQSSFTDGVSRDTQYSPYSGVVVDPFGGSVPSDGGYPAITDYSGNTTNFYRGGAGTGGSTGCSFDDIYLTNFVAGFITSPSAQTLNAELMDIQRIQVENCKIGVAGCQDQEKLNQIRHFACWGGTYTLFCMGASDGYGAQRPGHWTIEGVNTAGRINRLVSRQGQGFFPMHIDNVYGESIGSIGDWGASQGDTLNRSIVDFENFNVWGSYPNYPTNSCGNFSGVTITHSSFRHYDGQGLPVIFNGGIFEDCCFDSLPYGAQELRWCSVGGNAVINPMSDVLKISRTTASRYPAGGRMKFVDQDNYNQGKQVELISKDYNCGAMFALDNLLNSTSSVVVSQVLSAGIQIGNSAVVTPPGGAADCARACPGKFVFDKGTGTLMGVIDTVSTSTYTLKYVPDGIVNGNYVMEMWCQVNLLSFMGDITSGSPTIQNVVFDFGNFTDLTNFVSGFVKIPGFYGFRAYTQEARVLAYNAGAGTITMDRNASQSATGYYFSSNGAVKEINTFSDGSGSGSTIAASEIMPKGSYYIEDVPNATAASGGRRVYIITQTGYWTNSPTHTKTELT